MNAPRVAEPNTPVNSDATYTEGAVLDIRAVVFRLLKLIWLPIVLGGIGLYLGVTDTLDFTPQYRASMIVLPNESGIGGGGPIGGGAGGGTGVGAAFSAFFGGGGSASSGPFDRLRILLKSEELAKRLDRQYGMIREVFASRWDEATQTWKVDDPSTLGLRDRAMRALHQGEPLAPGPEALTLFVRGKLQFKPVIIEGSATPSSPFWEVAVEDQDRDRALELLTRIYWAADDFLRDKERDSVGKKLKYLESRIREATVSEIRQSLILAMIKEERTAHLLRGDLPYAADIVVEPSVSDIKTRPVLVRTIGAPAMIGFGIGLGFALLIAIFRAENQSSVAGGPGAAGA